MRFAAETVARVISAAAVYENLSGAISRLTFFAGGAADVRRSRSGLEAGTRRIDDLFSAKAEELSLFSPAGRQHVAFDLALPFLGAALLGFRDFAMERVDIVLGSVGSRRRN